MKIAWFKREISPEVGCYIAGYGTEDLDDEYQGESDDYTDDYDERNAEDE